MYLQSEIMEAIKNNNIPLSMQDQMRQEIAETEQKAFNTIQANKQKMYLKAKAEGN